MATDPNAIQLTDEQRFLVAKLADKTGAPWPHVTDDALASYGAQQALAHSEVNGESFFVAAQRLGLIGCLEGGPADLSTNPIHMEGFGEQHE